MAILCAWDLEAWAPGSKREHLKHRVPSGPGESNELSYELTLKYSHIISALYY